MTRPQLRGLFVSVPRRLEVGFYTSSIDKFLQARLVLQEYGLLLRHFVSSQEPYHEDYSLGGTELLSRAIGEIKYRLGVNSLFFVEDTSVRIDALSTPGNDVPGMGVKEWFAGTSFRELDTDLRKRGDDRGVTVRSDIALHVPGLNRPVFVRGETHGCVPDTPPAFARSDQYPWLTPDTFNGWFIPAGAAKRLGEMSFEESWQYDFRVRALVALVDRLEEYAAALNLPGHSYSAKRVRTVAAGASLFREDVSLYVVIGRLCAGKTTLGQYVSSRYPYRWVEASGIMRIVAEEAGIRAPTLLYQAKDLLGQKGPDIVARQIVGIYANDLAGGAVVTGFRTIEEVQYMRAQFPGCKVVFVSASERTRFERQLRRQRFEDAKTLGEFRERDREQLQFGLLSVGQELADVRIENEGTMKDYHSQIEAVLKEAYGAVPGVSETKLSGKTLRETRLFRCLHALEVIAVPASCADIATLTQREEEGSTGGGVERISARHVNWVLKDVPELARRVDAKGDRVHYQLLPAGQTYLNVVRLMKG